MKIYILKHLDSHHCHLHLLQAANCCCNSRLVVDEKILKWVANQKDNIVVIKTAP